MTGYWLYGIPGDDGPTKVDGLVPHVGEEICFCNDASYPLNSPLGNEPHREMIVVGIVHVLDTHSGAGYRSVSHVYAESIAISTTGLAYRLSKNELPS